MLKLQPRQTPPQNEPGDEAIFYDPADPAWNHPLIAEQRQRLGDAAVANLPGNASDEQKATARAAAEARHPVSVWASAVTYFSPSAPLTVPERLRTAQNPTVARISDYFVEGQRPTEFVLRPLGARIYHKLRGRIAAGDQTWLLDAAKFGLVAIRNPDIELTTEMVDGVEGISEADLDNIDSQNRLLLLTIGAAVSKLTHQAPRQGKP